MSADDRGAQPTETFTPDEGSTTASAPAGAPARTPFRAVNDESDGPVRQTSPYGTGTAPSNAGRAPAKPAVAAAKTSTKAAAASATASTSAAIGVGVGKLKDIASKARETLTEGDDLAAANLKGGPRRARVLVSRVDPWSALKIGFLLSIAAGIVLVVATFVLWNVLNTIGVFALANDWVTKLFDGTQEVNLLQFFDRNKVMSAAMLIAVVNVVLLTALSTIGALLYNTVSSVVGGVYVTLTDD